MLDLHPLGHPGGSRRVDQICQSAGIETGPGGPAGPCDLDRIGGLGSDLVGIGSASVAAGGEFSLGRSSPSRSDGLNVNRPLVW
jgi:hypothetical protein